MRIDEEGGHFQGIHIGLDRALAGFFRDVLRKEWKESSYVM